MIKKLAAFFLLLMPNALRVAAYRYLFGYKIGRDVRIGFSLLLCKDVVIGDHVRIGNLCFFKNLNELSIGSYSTIGTGNHFTTSPEFADASRGNRPRLSIGEHCGISNFHYFDIQDDVQIGSFTTIAGVRSVFFTHQIDVAKSLQSTKPILIGSYCMIGSNISMVPGSQVGNGSVVGMGAVVTDKFKETNVLIAGNPAVIKKKLPADAQYMQRKQGFISSVLPSPFN